MLRRDAGLSTRELATRLQWSQSKVSKTELGHTLPSPDDVAAWARATDAADDARDDLVDLAIREGAQATRWRQALAIGRRRKQEELHRIEQESSTIRVFSPSIIVGLAQTRAYAEAIIRRGRKYGLAENVADVVDARMARQVLLDDESKSFVFIMGEAALRRRLVDDTQMRNQLEHLLSLTARSNVTIGVIPFDATETVHDYHGYAVLGDPASDDHSIVLVETVTRELAIRDTEEIPEYLDHFEALRAAAVEGDQLRSLVGQIIDAHSRP